MTKKIFNSPLEKRNFKNKNSNNSPFFKRGGPRPGRGTGYFKKFSVFRAVLLGSPIRKTLSPQIFAYFSDLSGKSETTNIPFEYFAVETPPQDLSAQFKAVKESGAGGVNITIPHKEKILNYIDRLSAEARAIGAVNTIKITQKGAIGYNTDWTGFLAPIKRRGVKLKGEEAVVLGAGGAARAIIYALLRGGVKRVFLFNRTLGRAKKVARYFGEKITPFALKNKTALNDALSRSPVLVVNATSCGTLGVGSPLPKGFVLPEETFAYDLVYRPTETPFLRLAKKSGARTISGLEMLVAHAAFAWRIWTGKKIPETVERRAFNIIKKKCKITNGKTRA